MPAKRAHKSSGNFDWQLLDRSILDSLDIESEYKLFGVEITGSQPNKDGWLACRGKRDNGKEDKKPSAAINVGNGPYRGRYVDHGTGLRLNFWNAAVRFGGFPNWRAARLNYAKKTNVRLPAGKSACSDQQSKPSSNGQAPSKKASNGEEKDTSVGKNICWVGEYANDYIYKNDLPAWLEAKKGVSLTAIQKSDYGFAWWDTGTTHSVIVFPIRDPADLQKIVGYQAYRLDGKDFPSTNELPQRKTHTYRGSRIGLILACKLDVFQAAKVAWLCEGVTDALALATRLPEGEVAVAVPGAESIAKEIGQAFQGKEVCITFDRDDAPQIVEG
jgi:hypothetical protein